MLLGCIFIDLSHSSLDKIWRM